MIKSIILLSVVFSLAACSQQENPLSGAREYPLADTELHETISTYCVDCHNPNDMEGDLDLLTILDGTLNDNPFIWQDVAWALQSREMPPKDEAGVARPDEATYQRAENWLASRLNSAAQSEALIAAQHPEQFLVQEFCLSCHNSKDKKGDVVLAQLAETRIEDNAELWERVLRKIEARQMPPPDRQGPSDAAYEHVIAHLTATLDQHGKAQAQLADTETFRRLTPLQYQNAVRDLLNVNIDAREYLPAEQHSHGFDNITVSNLSPTLMDRYINAAQKISRLAVAGSNFPVMGKTYRTRPDQTQEQHVPGLPLGTQGGMAVDHYFPVSGNYKVSVRLSRDRDEFIEGFDEQQSLEILLNGAQQKSFTLVPPKNKKNYAFDDSQLQTELFVPAGQHLLGVTFPQLDASLPVTKREPFSSAFNVHRHPRRSLAVYEVSITGPFKQTSSRSETPSRRRIFSCRPAQGSNSESCAESILQHLAHLAYRRPLVAADMQNLMRFYREGAKHGFEKGIEHGISAILVNPSFIFMVENSRVSASASTPLAKLSDYELASRLSFFIWNSLPDQKLLGLAEEGKLQNVETLRQQAQRMLQDPKALGMIRNFVAQWLYLRNLEKFTPNARRYPDFDNNLRQAMVEETLQFSTSVLRSSNGILNLIDANYSFLNQRLAEHYGIAGVKGSRFRRVSFDKDAQRGGLLRQASVLTVTSYATRTSPVVRGNWILENFIGTPPPPPPADVPSLDGNLVAESLPIRQRLNKHREDEACAGCHNLMDPVGFALENYDAVGRWRSVENGHKIDASAGLPHGIKFEGAEGLVRGMQEMPELFVRTFTEKLMTFALGRGLDYRDAPHVRAILRATRPKNFTFSAIVSAMVSAENFRFRALSDDVKAAQFAQEDSARQRVKGE